VTIPNLDFVTPQIATGGDLPPFWDDLVPALQAWQDLGITHVIDNREEWSDEDVVAQLAPEIRYLYNGVDDAGRGQPDRWFDDGVAWARQVLADPDAKVLIHCHMGINRGPSVGFAVLLALGWDPVEAIASIRRARPVANVWYAADALSWHQQRTGVDPETAAGQHAALAAWREQNPLDVVRVIREQRDRGL